MPLQNKAYQVIYKNHQYGRYVVWFIKETFILVLRNERFLDTLENRFPLIENWAQIVTKMPDYIEQIIEINPIIFLTHHDPTVRNIAKRNHP